jgi:hypothetical protein
MKRLWKRVVAGAVIVVVCLLNYRERRSYVCQVCFSGRDDYQWRVGDWGTLSLPITPTSSQFRFSGFAKDFALTNHQHQWKFAQGSPYFFFGTRWGGCALGGGRHTSDLFRIYETDDEFRKYVRDRIANGSISTAKFIELAGCMDREETIGKKQAEEFVEGYFEK